ncbi:D-alanyl-D-alanine carboxypeptidase [Metallumcola ferriviriculae]|uniref:serine-type D-Ala-D-Ala carboxypeptidase n=1 Tax=Metallumcola ferriviriculae TaxID=3039180 RepID=A0AAU0UNY8_9FIRM|nr:D-alanyl-D-alanine carboxypeptidase [Desulfitibacteraceae bacterium MK1]
MLGLKKTLNILLLIGIIIFQLMPPAWGAEIDINGKTAILIDQETGRVLYEKDAHLKREPASTTKILTALIALEKGNLSDMVSVSEKATKAEGTEVWLVEGEEHTLEDFIYAMMLNSANDAAVAVAEHVGGSVEGFARLMNERAAQLGLKGSHFTNPHGLTAPDHYTTVYDMAIIAREAMKIPKFRDIIITQTRPWHGEDWDSKLRNINPMLSYYPGSTGIKTGYTSQAGYCIVASATRNGKSFIAVVYGSDNKAIWRDAQKLLDYGFNNYDHVSLVKKGEEIATLDLAVGDKGETKGLKLISQEGFSYLVGGDENLLPERKLFLENLQLPIEKDGSMGHISFMLDGKEVARVPVVAGGSIKKPVTWMEWWVRISWVLVGFLFLRIFIRYMQKRRKRRKIYTSYRRRGSRRVGRY